MREDPITWQLTPEAKAQTLAAEWAREIGLPPNTAWERQIVELILAAWATRDPRLERDRT